MLTGISSSVTKHCSLFNKLFVYRMTSFSQRDGFWCITKNGKSLLLLFVDAGFKINQNIYLNNILIKDYNDKRFPWLNSHFEINVYVFQQASAPTHNVRQTQQWCQENLRDFISPQDWPLNSPGLNPFDSSKWRTLQSRACTKLHKNIATIKAAVICEWNGLYANYLQCAGDCYCAVSASASRQKKTELKMNNIISFIT